MKWTDITTYSRGDKVREPRIWELKLADGIWLNVHKYVGCGDAWFASARVVSNNTRMNCVDLQTEDPECAKARAIMKMRALLKDVRQQIDNAMSALYEVE